MAGRLLKCTPGKSYECGKICLTVKKRCRLKPQGKQEGAELAILGDLLESAEPKALPSAKEQSLQEQQEQKLKTSKPALEKTALDSYQEEFNQIFAKLPPTTPFSDTVRERDFIIVRSGGGILLGDTLSGDVYGDGVVAVYAGGIIGNKQIAYDVLSGRIKELKKEGKLRDGDLLVVASPDSKFFPRLTKIRVTESKSEGYEVELPTEREQAEYKLRSTLMDDARLSEVDRNTKPSQKDINRVAQHRKREEELFAELEKIHPRTPTSKKIDSNTYRKRAQEFVKELGLPPSANSFSDLQTRMHDIAHPVMYDMLGLSSKDIQKFFGTSDLIAEEALVNALEQMSRGEYPRAAAANGVRLARVLSRGTETASAYRNSEFSARVEFLVNKMFQNPDLYRYLKVVRKANRISRTVTTAAGV